MLLTFSTKAQLVIANGIGQTPQQMVQNFLLGGGVTVSNVKFNDSPNIINISNQIGSFHTNTNQTNLGFTNGLTIATGGVQVAISGVLTEIVNGIAINSDPQLQSLKLGKSLKDVARLEFDFIPSSDSIKFTYVFASNEYLTAVCTDYDDVFGFFISGPNPAGGNYTNKNIALVPGTNLPVSINTINSGISNGSVSPCFLNYTQYYHSFIPNITYRGGTVPLIASAKVIPCSTYHIKIAICDVTNGIYDSGVFLKANSFSSTPVAITKTFSNPTISDTSIIRGCNNAIIKFRLPNPLSINYAIPLIKQGSAINGIDYAAIPDTIFIPANSDSVILNITAFQNAGFITPKFIKLIAKTASCYYDTLIINILPNLPLNITAKGDTSVCPINNGVAVSVSASGGISPYVFHWNDGDTNLQRIVHPLASTLYQVTLIDKCNMVVKDSVLITVFPKINLLVNANPSIICKGQSAALNVSGANSYIWTSNIPDPGLQSQNNINNPIVKPLQTTLYYVSATDINGCKAKDSISVSVLPSLNPAIIAIPNPVSISDPTVHFTDASTGSVSWFWNTGDGFTTNQQDFIHTYIAALSGNYTVTLVVSNINGCTDSCKVEVVIFHELKLFIPNAFTPDLPNLNNVFKAYGEGIVWFEMLIYNRWGQLLFTSNDIELGWNGKFLNEAAAPGVYVYYINYKDISGKKFNRTGSLTLIR